MGKINKPLILVVTFILLSLFIGQALGSGTNIVTNGGCEDGLFHWLPADGYTQNEQSGITYHSGSRAFLDTELDATIGNSMSQEYPAAYNTSKIAYISFWAIATDLTGSVAVQMNVLTSTTGWQTLYDNATFDATTWTFINITSGWAANEQLNELKWFISCQGQGKVAIDDIQMWVDTGGGSSVPGVYSDPGAWGGVIDKFVGFMLPLVVILLPSVMLMVMTRRTDKWLLLIGLTIGSGLGLYFNLVPAWLLFLVVIGLVGMAYQSVRSGG